MDDIIIIILLILLNGVFSMSEIALVSARKSKLSSEARKGNKAARTALKLAEDPDRFLSTIQIGITLIGILTGLYSGAALADDVGRLLQEWGLPARTAHITGQIAIVAIVTYLSIVVGELVPKRIGLAVANTAAKLVSRPMHVLSIVAMPAVWLLSKSTAAIVGLLGLRKHADCVTEEEIKSLIQEGTDSGEVRKVEQDIMERALVLGDLRVGSIMTPKVDVCTLNLGMDAKAIKHMLSVQLHNSYPVYCSDDKNRICGVVSLKQLILTIDRPGFSLADVVSDPLYFPESMSVYDALERLKSKGSHCALVCDEFGDLSGVLTPGDILDRLVGEISTPECNTAITPTETDRQWSVDARMSFYDFLRHFNLEDLYIPATYSTVGGFLLEELKYFPAVGDTYEWNGIRFEVYAIEGAKIRTVAVSMLPEA